MNLPTRLNQTAFEWSVGMVLGDASLQSNNNKSSFRLKMQQSPKNMEYIEASKKILLPYILSTETKIKQREAGTSFSELVTLSHWAFNPVADLFRNPSEEVIPNSVLPKQVQVEIKKFLTPVAIASWFCGDGGRRDYGKNQGKAIQFHTQGFSEQCCKILVNSLQDNYGWNVILKEDRLSKSGHQLDLIQIEASSFEQFYNTITPYLLSSFFGRLPSLRKLRDSKK